MKANNALLIKLQRREDLDQKRRAARIIRAINGIGSHFHGHELIRIESIVEEAYGRVHLDRTK